MTKWGLIANAAVAIVIVVAYTVLSVAGVDGTALLGLLGGQGISAAIGGLAKQVTAG